MNIGDHIAKFKEAEASKAQSAASEEQTQAERQKLHAEKMMGHLKRVVIPVFEAVCRQLTEAGIDASIANGNAPGTQCPRYRLLVRARKGGAACELIFTSSSVGDIFIIDSDTTHLGRGAYVTASVRMDELSTARCEFYVDEFLTLALVP